LSKEAEAVGVVEESGRRRDETMWGKEENGKNTNKEGSGSSYAHNV
jgi:hypothetical protein